MELELVTIGNELLLGFTLDTNQAEISKALADIGIRVSRSTTVSDDPDAIRDVVASGLERTGFVITTGGLGPTRDDITKKVIADFFGKSLVLDEEYLGLLRERFAQFGRSMPQSNRTQAEVPEGSEVLPNRWGTAPGLWVEGDPGVVVMLPGVPKEMNGLLNEQLIPRLKKRNTAGSAIRSATLRTTGVSESALADSLEGIESEIAPATLAFLPSLMGVDLRLTVWNRPVDECDHILRSGLQALKATVSPYWYATGDLDLAEVLVAQLSDRRLKIATAESCTGGLVGRRITSVPGASGVYAGGIVAYENRIKQDFLGVSEDVLQRHGAVSEEVALAMARGAQDRFSVDLAVAITGIAGPSGGTEAKPVGTVSIAGYFEGAERVSTRVFPGTREEVRERSAQAALDLVWKLLTAE
ncbi:MAG: competence/damage-inducible protein A [Gemmatimonadota bacterium]|nr:competence/damage-inducible protein A [Gemmatimonadota bacterium]